MKLKIIAIPVAVILIGVGIYVGVLHYGNRTASASASVAVPPSGSTPLSASWVSDFDQLQALSDDLGARRVRVFEDQLAAAKKNPLDEYQLANDFMTGKSNRLGQQLQTVLQQNPGKTFDKDCRCLVPAPPKAAAENPAPTPPAAKK
jgi:hypothetical protein